MAGVISTAKALESLRPRRARAGETLLVGLDSQRAPGLKRRRPHTPHTLFLLFILSSSGRQTNSSSRDSVLGSNDRGANNYGILEADMELEIVSVCAGADSQEVPMSASQPGEKGREQDWGGRALVIVCEDGACAVRAG